MNTTRAATVFLTICLISTLSFGNETRKIIYNETEGAELLGFATGLYGDIAFLGAPAGRVLPGAGFIYDVTTGNKLHKLTPSEPRADDFFAFDGDLNQDFAIVGDPGNPSMVSSPGSVYIFDVATGNELRRVFPNDSIIGDEFGFGTSIDGTNMLIGAPNLSARPGSAYIFDVTTGNQLHELTSNESVTGDEFGWDVSIGGNYAVVGAPGSFEVLGLTRGNAYVFDVTTGQQTMELIANEGTPGDEFGFSIAVDGTTAIVGAPDGGVGAGSAYLFDLTTGQQLHRLTASDSQDHNDFGSAVEIHGDIALVGAQGQAGVPGATYVFNVKTGEELAKLTPSDLVSSDAFGTAISVFDGVVVASSPRDDDTGFNAGAAYVFAPGTGDFDYDGELTANDIDLLSKQARRDLNGDFFDLNDDSLVNEADRRIWIEEIANTYAGDANLDGEFSSDDFIIIFSSNEFEDGEAENSSWRDGDWNGDGEFSTNDLILAFQTGAYEKGPRVAFAAVPEPASVCLAILGLFGILAIQRNSRQTN